jgi:hypothetical protein
MASQLAGCGSALQKALAGGLQQSLSQSQVAEREASLFAELSADFEEDIMHCRSSGNGPGCIETDSFKFGASILNPSKSSVSGIYKTTAGPKSMSNRVACIAGIMYATPGSEGCTTRHAQPHACFAYYDWGEDEGERRVCKLAVTAATTSGASMTICGRPWENEWKKSNGKVNGKKVYPIPGHEWKKHGQVIRIEHLEQKELSQIVLWHDDPHEFEELQQMLLGGIDIADMPRSITCVNKICKCLLRVCMLLPCMFILFVVFLFLEEHYREDGAQFGE